MTTTPKLPAARFVCPVSLPADLMLDVERARRKTKHPKTGKPLRRSEFFRQAILTEVTRLLSKAA